MWKRIRRVSLYSALFCRLTEWLLLLLLFLQPVFICWRCFHDVQPMNSVNKSAHTCVWQYGCWWHMIIAEERERQLCHDLRMDVRHVVDVWQKLLFLYKLGGKGRAVGGTGSKGLVARGVRRVSLTPAPPHTHAQTRTDTSAEGGRITSHIIYVRAAIRTRKEKLPANGCCSIGELQHQQQRRHRHRIPLLIYYYYC